MLRLEVAWVLVGATDAGWGADGHAGGLAVGWASARVRALGCGERCEWGWESAFPCETR